MSNTRAGASGCRETIYIRPMPRPPRAQVPSALYHVTSRGNRRQTIFVHDWDRAMFLHLLDDLAAKLSWRFLGYCLMPNHYHLVVETPNADLSAGMHRLNSRYAHWFNWRHDLDGHLFQGRFHAVLLESHWHLLELSRYLAVNPVRAGLCERPDDWRWSSYLPVLGRTPVPAFLAADDVLRYFGSEPAAARRAFSLFVRDGAQR